MKHLQAYTAMCVVKIVFTNSMHSRAIAKHVYIRHAMLITRYSLRGSFLHAIRHNRPHIHDSTQKIIDHLISLVSTYRLCLLQLCLAVLVRCVFCCLVAARMLCLSVLTPILAPTVMKIDMQGNTDECSGVNVMDWVERCSWGKDDTNLLFESLKLVLFLLAIIFDFRLCFRSGVLDTLCAVCHVSVMALS